MIRPSRVVPALEKNVGDFWRLVGDLDPRAECGSAHGVSLVSLHFPNPIFNLACDARIVAGREQEAIWAAREFFETRHMPWRWHVGPGTEPSHFARHLSAAGFSLAFRTPGMAVDLAAYRAPARHPSVMEVSDEASLQRFLEPLSRAFGLPMESGDTFLRLHASAGWALPLRYFYSVQDGSSVSCAMVYFGAGVAGIYCVGTVGEARRQGHAERLIHACLGAASEHGYDVAILQSSQMGYSLYERLGFRTLCEFECYDAPR